MKISPLCVLSRAAVFETDCDTCYFAPEPFKLILNGEERGTSEKNVFTLYDLTPGMYYDLRVRQADGTGARATFVTPEESSVHDVALFGAAGDGKTDCTGALQAAVCACPPGGTVYVPPGDYLTYPIFLKSDMLLYLSKGARLIGGTQRERYPVLPGMVKNEATRRERSFGTWEGNPLDSYASLLTAIDARRVFVAGEGTIDANGQHGDWWENPKVRRGAWRPRTAFFNGCQEVVLAGVTLRNSPSWTVHPYYCKDVRVLDIAINNPPDTPNTDGCNPESCEDVRIIGAHISVGDDCISVKSGKYYMSQRHHAPSRGIQVRNCFLERGHGGVVAGSEISAGIQGLFVKNCLMRDTDRGLRIKTRRGRGESCRLADIEFSHIVMENVCVPLCVNMFYFCDPDGHSAYVRSKAPCPVDEYTPGMGKLYCHDLRCTGCQHAGGFFYGLPEKPIEEIRLENVEIAFDPNATPGLPAMMDDIDPVCKLGLFAANVETLRLQNVRFSGCEGEEVQIQGVPHFSIKREEEALC